jgi:hypothetical protein
MIPVLVTKLLKTAIARQLYYFAVAEIKGVWGALAKALSGWHGRQAKGAPCDRGAPFCVRPECRGDQRRKPME